ncbi:TPA: Ger(x)C family spore germination protein [Bacillus cereus]|uniref:Ger(x)C family spore germination protein n=1 Tax=Bacillus sp. FSL M8-0139 TaxID=2921613 RepID=UPI0030F727E0|nr:Ger(x)C family spore germination protein [Bacillus cereus]
MKLFYVKRMLIGCIVFFLGSGCLPKTIIDDVNLVQAVIFEAYKKQLRMTFIAPQRTKGNKVQIFQSTAHSMKGAKQLANIQAGRPLVSGQLRVALFSQSLAEQGLSASIDVLTREASIGHALQIAIIEGDVKKFVTYPYQTTENVSLYLYRLLNHNMDQGVLPHMNLHASSFKFYQEGSDTFFPIVRHTNGKIHITGVALFKREKMVGEVKAKDLFIFKGLLEKHAFDMHTFSYGSNSIVIQNIVSQPKYTLKTYKGTPAFFIDVHIKGRIQEITGNENLQQRHVVKRIEQAIEQDLKRKSQYLIQQFQVLHTDPLGLGKKWKAENRSFQEKEWEEQYPNFSIHTSYHVTLTNSGVVE